MFRHHGSTRASKHNLRVASLLSFVAGIVNITGFISVERLTTNVTGHFAFLIDRIIKLDFLQAFIYMLYIFFFFLGSFISNFLIEFRSNKYQYNTYLSPVILEAVILFGLAAFSKSLYDMPNILAFCLLFAMGLQNSLVTMISNAIVRTTHLTGLFTDLGIELSQLFFYKLPAQRKRLKSSIKLRMTIIAFFFLGGIFGGIFYSILELQVLMFGALLLIFGIIYDGLRFKYITLKRQYLKRNKTH